MGLAKEVKETRGRQLEHERELHGARKAQVRAESTCARAEAEAGEGAPSWNFGEWAFSAPERAWGATGGFAREMAPKAREASRRALDSIPSLESASGTLGRASNLGKASAARASQAARGGAAALRKGAGAAAKHVLNEVKSVGVQPVG